VDKKRRIAIIGAGVSGLTCAVLFAEKGYATAILAEQIGDRTDSAAAAAIWYPYDVAPAEAVMPWALIAYDRFLELTRDPSTGVSVVELHTFSRLGPLAPPGWARPFRPRALVESEIPAAFVSGFSLRVPLIETTKYLEYLKMRAGNAGASLIAGVHLENLEEVEARFELVVNCSGIGAKELVPDPAMEPHRGQVAIVAKLDLSHAVVCDDPPLMYAIPRSQDCVLGGMNDVSDNRAADSTATARIVAECQRVLGFAKPTLLAERVGLRPCRNGGVRVGAEIMRDGRTVIHNYGHGGAGFTLSWGCAQTALDLARGVVAGIADPGSDNV
jgi:D-amino-acid oxidase